MAQRSPDDAAVLRALRAAQHVLQCAACTGLLVDPVVLQCGHFCCRSCTLPAAVTICPNCQVPSIAHRSLSLLSNLAAAASRVFSYYPPLENSESSPLEQGEAVHFTGSFSLSPSHPSMNLLEQLPVALTQSPNQALRTDSGTPLPVALLDVSTIDIQREISVAKHELESLLRADPNSYSLDRLLRFTRHDVAEVKTQDLVPVSSGAQPLSPLVDSVASQWGLAAPPTVHRQLFLSQSQPTADRLSGINEPCAFPDDGPAVDLTQSPVLLTRQGVVVESLLVKSPLETATASPVHIVATFGTDSARELVRRCSERGWVATDGAPVSVQDERRILVTALESAPRRLVTRTMLYMKCLALGFLIVDFTWLEDSLAHGELLLPHAYEVKGTVLDTVPSAPMRARYLGRGPDGSMLLLHGYSFILIADPPSPLFSVRDVEDLIVMAGGTMASSDPAADAAGLHLTLAMQLPPRPSARAAATSERSHSCAWSGRSVGGRRTHYSVGWLFDAVCNLRLPSDLSNYRVEE